jgi:hypothetical protein
VEIETSLGRKPRMTMIVRFDDDSVSALLPFWRCCFGGAFFWSRGVVTTGGAFAIASFCLLSGVFVLFSVLLFFFCAHP